MRTAAGPAQGASLSKVAGTAVEMAKQRSPLIFAIKHLHIAWDDADCASPSAFRRTAFLMQGPRAVPPASDETVTKLLALEEVGRLPQGAELQLLELACPGWPSEIVLAFHGLSVFSAGDVRSAKACARQALMRSSDCLLARQLASLAYAQTDVRCPPGVDVALAPDVPRIVESQPGLAASLAAVAPVAASAAATTSPSPVPSRVSPERPAMSFWKRLFGTSGRKAMTTVDSNYGLQVDKPVRCGDGPAGERAYLDRLRCPGGKNVKYRRRGSMLSPASTKPVDAYDVECNCGQHQIVVYMDMYAKTPAVPVGSSGWTLTG